MRVGKSTGPKIMFSSEEIKLKVYHNSLVEKHDQLTS